MGAPKETNYRLAIASTAWQVISIRPKRQLVMLFRMKAPGLGRLTLTITDTTQYRQIDVRALWHPAGFNGLLYWFAMMPAHLFIFKGMAKRIASLAEARDDHIPS